VLGKATEDDETGDRLLDANTGDETGSLKDMIAMYAGGASEKPNGDPAQDHVYAGKVLKEIGEAEGTSECFMCASEIFDEVLLPCYHRG